MAVEKIGCQLQMLGIPVIVSVHESDVSPHGLLHPCVSRPRHAAVNLGNQADSGVMKRLDDGNGLIGRTVIHDDDLKILKCLNQY